MHLEKTTDLTRNRMLCDLTTSLHCLLRWPFAAGNKHGNIASVEEDLTELSLSFGSILSNVFQDLD
jgi:hypothetical protein